MFFEASYESATHIISVFSDKFYDDFPLFKQMFTTKWTQVDEGHLTLKNISYAFGKSPSFSREIPQISLRSTCAEKISYAFLKA